MPAKRKVSKKKTPTRRRRTNASKASTTKKTAPTKRKSSTALDSQVKTQLEIYKNPHTMITTHPKIPDGKVPRSLGLSNQAAGELVCSLTASPGGQPGNPAGLMHILLYSGQNSGGIVYGSNLSYTPASGSGSYNNALAPGEMLSWEGSPDLSFGSISSSTGGTITTTFEYSSWRTVSQGLTLGLLNPAESDDGWWEMVRVTDTVDPDDYQVKNRIETTATAFGSVTPHGKLVNSLITRNLGNNNSYRTGLLRDIHNEYFQLLPSYKDHDFLQQADEMDFQGTDINASMVSGAIENGRYVKFDNTDDSKNFINGKIDPSYDMVYIRIHGRTSGEATRLHYNLCANHEVTYASTDIEGRFMTPTVKNTSGVEKTKDAMHADEQKKSSSGHAKKKHKSH